LHGGLGGLLHGALGVRSGVLGSAGGSASSPGGVAGGGPLAVSEAGSDHLGVDLELSVGGGGRALILIEHTIVVGVVLGRGLIRGLSALRVFLPGRLRDRHG